MVDLDTYINEDGVWSLVFAPTVRADTKKEVSKWLRNYVLTESKKNKEGNSDDKNHTETISVKVSKSEKEINITIMM